MRVAITRDGRTTRVAVMPEDAAERVVGEGVAFCAPGDHFVPKIGESLALARALVDLGQKLEERWAPRVVSEEELTERRKLHEASRRDAPPPRRKREPVSIVSSL